MSAPRREGPTFLAWLSGRFTYPPSTARCAQCGRRGGDPEVARALRNDGMKDAAAFASLCDDCRRKARDQRVMRAISGD
jgi:hypothetical protein